MMPEVDPAKKKAPTRSEVAAITQTDAPCDEETGVLRMPLPKRPEMPKQGFGRVARRALFSLAWRLSDIRYLMPVT
jgi:hypothetical protein